MLVKSTVVVLLKREPEDCWPSCTRGSTAFSPCLLVATIGKSKCEMASFQMASYLYLFPLHQTENVELPIFFILNVIYIRSNKDATILSVQAGICLHFDLSLHHY